MTKKMRKSSSKELSFRPNRRRRRVALFQLSMPSYRLAFFARLCEDPHYSISLFAARPERDGCKSPAVVQATQIPARVYRFKLPFCSSYLKFQPAVIHELRSPAHDVLILGNDILSIDVWVSCLLARLMKRRICLWGHGFSRPDTRMRVWLRRRLINLAHSVLFYTEETRQIWMERGVPEEKLFVAYNALDTENIARVKAMLTAAHLERFRTAQGVRGKSIVIFCGRLMERKSPEILLRAMALVVRRIPQAHAFIVGDGPLRKKLECQARKLGLVQSTTFFGEISDETLLAKCFLCSRVSVIPSAAGLGVQHAFGYGVPVIVGDDMGGHGPEVSLVTEGVTGLYCRNDDAESFAEAIGRVLMDKRLRRRMGVNALKKVESEFTLASMAKGFSNALEHCFNDARRSTNGKPSQHAKNGACNEVRTASVS